VPTVSARTLIFGIALAALAATSAVFADPGAESQARAAAEKYLRALVASDRPTMRELTPRELANKFGPCPFTSMPRFEPMRVDAHAAGVMFRSVTDDPDLPETGAVTLTMLDGPDPSRWRVRQVVWFDALPPGLKIPAKSVTSKDRAQEAAAIAATKAYISAWMKGDYVAMSKLHYDWLSRTPLSKPVTGELKSVEMTVKALGGDEYKVRFKAKVIFYRVVPIIREGVVYVLKENGQWRVRGNGLCL
jgi:hypothetical protein